MPLASPSTERLSPARLDELLEFAPENGSTEEVVFWLVRLVEWLRPAAGQRIVTKTKLLERQLAQNEEWRARVAKVLVRLLGEVDLLRFFAHAGIATDFHLGGAVREWLLTRALPAACKTDDASEIVRLAFRPEDLAWVRHPSVLVTFGLFVDDEARARVVEAARSATLDLAHQVVAQAHSPGIRVLQTSERSPYTGLYEAVRAFLDLPIEEAPYRALVGRIRQCELLRHAHGTELVDRGASLNTTFQLRRLQMQLRRLRELADALHERTLAASAALLRTIVGEVLENTSGSTLWRRSADLVLQNIVDSAADVGRTYLDDDHSTWRAAFWAGAGGGLVMVAATILKYRLALLHLPDLYEGLVFSLNYAAAFCSAYLLHWTIATKLPAHTAAALARSAQEGEGHGKRLDRFAEVWRSTIRLQIAGLVGNLAVAAPVAYGLDVASSRFLHFHWLAPDQAHHVLTSNSILGPSTLYAALTGLFLWVSSLVGALVANWVRVIALADRLATNAFVLRRLSIPRARHIADRISNRIGGLAGNASLGFMLGGIPALFAIAHLPVEIRHITVSTTSVALAVSAGAATRTTLSLALGGLAMIAVVNVVTSFALALWLSLRATRGFKTSPSSRGIAWLGMLPWRGRKKKRADEEPPVVHSPAT